MKENFTQLTLKWGVKYNPIMKRATVVRKDSDMEWQSVLTFNLLDYAHIDHYSFDAKIRGLVNGWIKSKQNEIEQEKELRENR